LYKISVTPRENDIAEKMNVKFTIRNDYQVFKYVVIDSPGIDYSNSQVALIEQGEDGSGNVVFSSSVNIPDKKDETKSDVYFLFKLKPNSTIVGENEISFKIELYGERLVCYGDDSKDIGVDVAQGTLEEPDLKIDNVAVNGANLSVGHEYFSFQKVQFAKIYYIYIDSGMQPFALIKKFTEGDTEKTKLEYLAYLTLSEEEKQTFTKPEGTPDNWLDQGEVFSENDPAEFRFHLFPGAKTYRVSAYPEEGNNLYLPSSTDSFTVIGMGKVKLQAPAEEEMTVASGRLFIPEVAGASKFTVILYPPEKPYVILYTVTKTEGQWVIEYDSLVVEEYMTNVWESSGSVIPAAGGLDIPLAADTNGYKLIIEGNPALYISTETSPLFECTGPPAAGSGE